MKANKKDTTLQKPNILKVFTTVFPVMFKATPVLLIFSFVISVFHGLSFGAKVLFQQSFFDKATDFASGKDVLSSAVISLLVFGLIVILSEFLNGVSNFIPNILIEKGSGKLSFKIHQKIAKLLPIDFEDTNKLDDINKAQQGKNNAIFFVFIFITILTFYIPYFIFMGWYLFTLKPILLWCIFIIFIPIVLTQILRTKVFTKLEDKSAPIRREYDYYADCMAGRQYLKETRQLGAFYYFKNKYVEILKLLNKYRLAANVKTNLAELSMKILTVIGYCGVLWLLFDALMKGEITVGAFAAVFASLGSLYSIMEEVVCRHIGQIAQNLGTIQNYINFLNLEERTSESIKIPKECDITLKNVSFSYPKSENFAVENASITIKNGETIAIVGENGSGKSTIIKLITGLYLPNSGEVFYGDVCSKNASMESLFEHTSAVFQKYCKYQMILSDNISISNVDKKVSEEGLDIATSLSGFSKDEDCFSDGYNTMLSREFDGTDLSGGQWQRVALARAFYKEHNFIVLDEPTAAIDPIEETKIYNRFAEIAKDKTAIIVTHRLGSVKLADRIIVMKSGKIVGVGTHSELIENNKEYTRMYESQQQWYL